MNNTGENDTPPAGANAAADNAVALLRLPDFWPETPSSWFVFVESKFRVKNITSEHSKFDLVVGCLPRDSIRQVLDILENPDATTPYTTLKQRLLDSHELTDFQRMELLHCMEPLGARKPSELLSQMLEACPRGQENNMFFLFLFLQRLSKELRVLFAEDDLKNPRDLAAKADKHWALLSHQHGTVAAIEAAEDDTAIAAVQSGQYRGRGGRHGRGQRKRGRGGYHTAALAAQDGQAAATAPNSTAPGTLARLATGLCHFYWSFGEKARQCEKPCKWEN
jgi:hypothetical protein